MAESKMWLVVADDGRAALYSASSALGPLTELRDLIEPESRLREQDLVSDRPGRAFDSGGEGRHSMEPRTSALDVQSQRFAKRLADMLDEARVKGRYEHLGVVAPPQFLGLLRKELSTETARRVVLEVDKDLTRFDADGVRRRLPERLFETLL
jgi:protein required for attachment to host cells